MVRGGFWRRDRGWPGMGVVVVEEVRGVLGRAVGGGGRGCVAKWGRAAQRCWGDGMEEPRVEAKELSGLDGSLVESGRRGRGGGQARARGQRKWRRGPARGRDKGEEGEGQGFEQG